MAALNLNGPISLTDLSSWVSAPDSRVDIRITKNARFDPGVDGVALGLLHGLRVVDSEIDVQSTFDPLDAGRPLEIYRSLTGLSLLLSSSRMTVITENSPTNTPGKFISPAERLWNYILLGGGEIGDGQSQLVVIRDPDFALPIRLQMGGSARFPYPETFFLLLKRMSRRLSENVELSDLPNDRAIASFLYEAALNSHEHGRFQAHHEISGTPSTIRGVSVEKIRFASKNELNARSKLSQNLRNYFENAWPQTNSSASFLCATVADVGPGIHHTLPPEEGETTWHRLERAFLPGVTKKPSGAAKGLGEGLPSIVESARRLNALLLVNSAELFGYFDFSQSAAPELIPISLGLQKKYGTSLSLIWPISFGRGEQVELF